MREAVDFVFWPCALDPKRSDVEALDDGEIAFSLISGAVRTSEQEEMAKLLRQKSKVVVAFGSCACTGGIPALANLKSKREIFDRAYLESPTNVNPEGILPVGHSKTFCRDHGRQGRSGAGFPHMSGHSSPRTIVRT